MLDDLEHARIQTGNRIGALERQHGEALPHLYAIHANLQAVEHQAELELVRAWRKHPLAPWAKAQHGVGEKSVARLIAEIGDPAVRTLGHWAGEGAEREWVTTGTEPRRLRELYAYCGVGDPARNRIPKGAVQADLMARGKTRAKKQLWLIATGMLKAGNRDTYDQARERYADRVHDAPCPQCHAKAGDEWKDGHKHAAALRYVAKAFLRELWEESTR